jgi:hypothetical protein
MADPMPGRTDTAEDLTVSTDDLVTHGVIVGDDRIGQDRSGRGPGGPTGAC